MKKLDWALSYLPGVYTIDDKLVRVDMGEAFESHIPFDALAAHLHATPEALFVNLLTQHGNAAIEGARQIVRWAIYCQNFETEAGSPDKAELFYHPGRVIDALGRARRESDAVFSRRNFPNSIVPTHRQLPGLGHALSLQLVVRVSASMKSLLELGDDAAKQIHGYLENYRTEFEDLRSTCASIRHVSRKALRYAKMAKKPLSDIIPRINKLESLLTAMLRYYDEEKAPSIMVHDHWMDVIGTRSNLGLLRTLYAKHVLEESTAAKSRDRSLEQLRALLESVPIDAATRLLAFSDHAPGAVWFEYHAAMRECAKALTAAPRRLAEPLIRKHFGHVVRKLVEAGSPSFDPEAFEDEAARALGRSFKKTAAGFVAPLGDGEGAAFVFDGAVRSDFKQLLEDTLEPVSRIEAVADIASKVGPLLASYLAESAGSGDRVGAMLFQMILPLSGLGQTTKWERQAVEILSAQRFRPESAVAHLNAAYQENIEEALSAPADRLDELMYGNLVWPTVRTVLHMAAMREILSQKKTGPTAKDYAELAENAGQVIGLAAKVASVHYSMALNELSGSQAAKMMAHSEVGPWLEFVSGPGTDVMADVLAIWVAYESAAEKSRRGDRSGHREVDAALMGLAVTLLGMVNPAAGVAVSLLLGIVETLRAGRTGTLAHTQVYFEKNWGELEEKIRNKLKLQQLYDEGDIERSDAFRSDMDTLTRIAAANMNILGRVSGGRLWLWSIAHTNRGQCERDLRDLGFSSKEINYLRAY